MAQFQLPDFIEEIVASIRDTGQVFTAVETAPGSNVWTITTDTVENLSRFIQIDSNGAVFEVVSVSSPEFVVKAVDKDLGTPPLDIWKSQAPYFHHGTPMKINGELLHRMRSIKVYPAVLMLETVLVDRNDDRNTTIYKSASPRLFFMASAKSASNTTNTHYAVPVALMQIYVERFNKAIKVHPHLAERTTTHTENVRVNWGNFINNRGNVEKIITADLSGVEYTSLLEIERSVLCDFDGLNWPRTCPGMTKIADNQDPQKSSVDLNASINDAAIKAIYCDLMAVDFVADVTTIEIGETVSFTDLTTGLPTDWTWVFGDGNISLLQNPSNTFLTPGDFDVVLKALNQISGGKEIKLAYITVTLPSFANLYAMEFSGVGTSINIPSSTDYDFGSGDFAFLVTLKRDAIGSSQTVIGKNVAGAFQFDLTFISANRLRMQYSKNGSNLVSQQTSVAYTSTSTVLTILAQKRANVYGIWVNGSAVALDALVGTHGAMHVTTNPLTLGMQGIAAFPNNFVGVMDDSSLWKTSFSPAEAIAITGGGITDLLLNVNATDLVGWSRQGDGATFGGGNWSFPDDSTNNNGGQSVGMPEPTRVSSLA